MCNLTIIFLLISFKHLINRCLIFLIFLITEITWLQYMFSFNLITSIIRYDFDRFPELWFFEEERYENLIYYVLARILYAL